MSKNGHGITYDGEIDGGEGDVTIIDEGPNTINITGDIKTLKGVTLINSNNKGSSSKITLHDVDAKGTLNITTNTGGSSIIFKKGIKARNVVITSGENK